MSMITYWLSVLNTPIFFVEGSIGIILAILLTVSISKKKEEIEEMLFPMMLGLQIFGINVNYLFLIISSIMFIMNLFGFSFLQELYTRIRGGD